MAILGPFSVGYPVAFRSGGDAVNQAFGKHIQEFERVYGILNALDNNKVDSSAVSDAISGELTKHINSTNPHPNWKPSYSFGDIDGTLDGSKITGNIDGSKISGRIDASKIFGNLDNATITAGNVTGLEVLVASLTGSGLSLSDIIANWSDFENDGAYIRFANGICIQIATETINAQYIAQFSFKRSFSKRCFGMCGTIAGDSARFKVMEIEGMYKSEFQTWIDVDTISGDSATKVNIYGKTLHYAAIGY